MPTTPETIDQIKSHIDQNITGKTQRRSITPPIEGGVLKTMIDFIASFFIPTSAKGANGGVATLGSDGKLSDSQRPPGGGTVDLPALISSMTAADLDTLTGDDYVATSVGKLKLSFLRMLLSENLFLDGLMFITESTVLTADHENKYLVMGNSDIEEIILTMPNEAIFTGGKLGMYFITDGGFNVFHDQPVIKPVIKQTDPNAPDTKAQMLKFTTYVDDEFGVSGIALESSSDAVVLDDDENSVTATRFLLDKAKKYKVYTALLTQSGTDAPSATILENTIGNIVWTRTSIGLYSATLIGAFTDSKTFVTIGNASDGDLSSITLLESIRRNSIDEIVVTIQHYLDVTPATIDGVLNRTPVEIRVYQ